MGLSKLSIPIVGIEPTIRASGNCYFQLNQRVSILLLMVQLLHLSTGHNNTVMIMINYIKDTYFIT